MKKILSTKTKKMQKKIQEAPKKPGVYLYYNKRGTVIYVGKAKVLFNRVKSYFGNFERMEEKYQHMIQEAHDIQMIELDSEFEALVLETNLIKKYRPKYNTALKDDKSYIFIRFEKVRRSNQPIPKKTGVYQDFPRVTTVRANLKKDDGAEYFGPFPDSRPIKRVLKRLRKIFPYRTSKDLVYVDENGTVVTTAKKPCFYYHIGLCKGACIGHQTKEDYLKDFNNLRRFFKGEKNSIINDLEREMKRASKVTNFELAAKLRDKIRDVQYATAYISIDNTTDDVVIDELKEEQRRSALNQLVEELKFPSGVLSIDSLNTVGQTPASDLQEPQSLKRTPNFRIECYDISNIQGTNPVGSMVVNIDGQMEPSLYRRFKIKYTKEKPNDFAMMKEVLIRRFRQYFMNNSEKFDEEYYGKDLLKRAKNWKTDESFKQKPDLIIIDGGKGQLSATYKILFQMGLHNEIPIVGLAKKDEEIFKMTYQFRDDSNQINDMDSFSRVYLPRRSEALFLVQRIRDEAHRFAISYHKNLRSRKALNL